MLVPWIAGGVLGAWVIFGKEVKPKAMPIMLPGKKNDFTVLLLNAINAVHAELPKITKQLIIAQAAYESGWGRTRAFQQGNNPFNITRVSSSPLPVIMGPDTDGQGRPITQRFAAYPSLDASVTDYLDFINKSRYGEAYNELMAGNLNYISELRNGGYFTQDLETYSQNMASLLHSVSDVFSTLVGLA